MYKIENAHSISKFFDKIQVNAHQNLKDKSGAPELKELLSEKKRRESTLNWLRHSEIEP